MQGQACDRVKQALRQETERAHSVREAIYACRPAGSSPSSAPRAAIHEAAARSHQSGDIDPSFVVTHRLGLDQAPEGYETSKHKLDECMKVVLKPNSR